MVDALVPGCCKSTNTNTLQLLDIDILFWSITIKCIFLSLSMNPGAHASHSGEGSRTQHEKPWAEMELDSGRGRMCRVTQVSSEQCLPHPHTHHPLPHTYPPSSHTPSHTTHHTHTIPHSMRYRRGLPVCSTLSSWYAMHSQNWRRNVQRRNCWRTCSHCPRCSVIWRWTSEPIQTTRKSNPCWHWSEELPNMTVSSAKYIRSFLVLLGN